MSKYLVTFEEVCGVTYIIHAESKEELNQMLSRGELPEPSDQQWIDTLDAPPIIEEF